jgi:hypothetical protein
MSILFLYKKMKMYLKVKHCKVKKEGNLCIANGAYNLRKLPSKIALTALEIW